MSCTLGYFSQYCRITGGSQKAHGREGKLRTGIRGLLFQGGLPFQTALIAGIGKVPGSAGNAGPGFRQLMALIAEIRRGFRTAVQADFCLGLDGRSGESKGTDQQQGKQQKQETF